MRPGSGGDDGPRRSVPGLEAVGEQRRRDPELAVPPFHRLWLAHTWHPSTALAVLYNTTHHTRSDPGNRSPPGGSYVRFSLASPRRRPTPYPVHRSARIDDSADGGVVQWLRPGFATVQSQPVAGHPRHHSGRGTRVLMAVPKQTRRTWIDWRHRGFGSTGAPRARR